jgi:hypothetical protein
VGIGKNRRFGKEIGGLGTGKGTGAETMRTQNLQRRVEALEVKRPGEDRQETQAILAKCTDEELDRLRDIIRRTDEWQKEPTEEEACFLAELMEKYVI